ncbi:MAG: hypothetical protein PVG35_00225 [Desulfobacterales bacterium]|jgi:Ni/Co efflux regulator RcnB
MQKKIVIISIALLTFAVAFAGNSWAARERGGDRHAVRGDRFQATDNPVNRAHLRGRGDGHSHRRDVVRPGPRFKHNYFKRHHYRPAHRFKPKYYRRHPKFRHWRHRPLFRHGRPGHFKWRHSQSVVKEINNYYGSADGYALPAEEFQASASVSDSGFSVSVGASKTN